MPRIGGNPRATLAYDDGGRETLRDDGSIVIDLNDYRESLPSEFEMRGGEAVEAEAPFDLPEGQFGENLVAVIDPGELARLGDDLVAQVEEDIEERSPWRDRFQRGLEQMGLVESDIDDGPFPGASNAVHPLLIEAVVQFWARAMAELFPPEGPAKGKVMGRQTQDKQDRADRVAEYLNFEMTTLDEGYVSETSRLVWAIPFYGSAFRKTFRDPIYNQNVGVYVPAEDLIVPAEATDLRTTPRFAHRMRKSRNEIRRLQLVGYYAKVDLGEPGTGEPDEIRDLKDETMDIAPDGDERSANHELFEVCIELSLPGDEHRDEHGEETGLERSYIVTVDRHSRKVLAIYRGWDEHDPLCKRKVYVEHYQYVPGMGFYGYGLFHLIGGLQLAATGSLRVLLDGAASASLSGGFVSKQAGLKGKRLVTTPGVWEPVDASIEDLSKAFFPAPVKEPSAALFQLLGFLTEAGQRFTSTTELQVGDKDPKGSPVGSTQMMIEQGGKVMSTIHRMLHASLTRELRLRYELCREHAPADGYPYEVANQQRTVYADDFAEGVSVVPVSDPNIFSSQQRLAQAQAVYQIAMESGVIPPAKAARRVLEAMRVPDIDQLIPEDQEPHSYDPIGEIQAMLLAKPIKVTPEQNHVAHLQALAAFANNPQFGNNKQVQQQIGPAFVAVVGQHMAYAWATHARGLGIPAGYMDPMSGQVGGAGTPEQIAAMVAQVAPQLAQVPGLPPLPDSPGKGGEGDDKGKLQIEYAKLEIERERHQQQMQMEADKHQFELAKEQAKLEAEKQRNELKSQVEMQKAQLDMQLSQQQGQMKMQQAQQDAEQQRMLSQQQMSIEAESASRQQRLDQQSMQHEQAMGQQKMDMQGQQHQQKLAQADQQHQQKQAHVATAPPQQHQQHDPHQQAPHDKLSEFR